jgi:hypothetical protein
MVSPKKNMSRVPNISLLRCGNGRREPGLHVLEMLAGTFKITVSELLKGI